jgi:hypothetical protein
MMELDGMDLHDASLIGSINTLINVFHCHVKYVYLSFLCVLFPDLYFFIYSVFYSILLKFPCCNLYDVLVSIKCEYDSNMLLSGPLICP